MPLWVSKVETFCCTDNCHSAARYAISKASKFVFYPSHCLTQGLALARHCVNVSFSYVSVDNGLATHGVSSIHQMQEDHEGGKSSGEEEGDKCDSEPILNCTNAHADYTILTSYFYMHSTGMHDEQNILNLERVICMQVLMQFFTC